MSIFNPSNIFTQNTNSHEEQAEFYVPAGHEDYTENSLTKSYEDNDYVCAKKIVRNNGTAKYMIKIDRASKFFNPFSIYDSENVTTFLESVCRSDKKFKEVNEKSFILYVKFLASKNMALLNNSEREDF
jgi:hypothetical protein